MFPGSNIAKKYNQDETKMNYTVQFGIAPFVKEKMVSVVANKPFSFKFDKLRHTKSKSNTMLV